MKQEKRCEEISKQIIEFVNDPNARLWSIIKCWSGTRFIVCGSSGSGKSWSIDLANNQLPSSAQIAESRELLWEREPAKAIDIFEDKELEYKDSSHIAFNVVNSNLAKELEAVGVKVFWIDS